MPFGRDTRVVPSNIVLDRGPGSPRKGRGDPRFGVETPIGSDAAYRKTLLNSVATPECGGWHKTSEVWGRNFSYERFRG